MREFCNFVFYALYADVALAHAGHPKELGEALADLNETFAAVSSTVSDPDRRETIRAMQALG